MRRVVALASGASARRLALVAVLVGLGWLFGDVAPLRLEEAAVASEPQPACRPKERQVLRRVGRVELYLRPAFSPDNDLFACLEGQRYAFETSNGREQPPYWPRWGPPMLQIAGPYLARVAYDYCGKDPFPCGGPFGFVADLRYQRSLGRAARFDHTVKVRVNERGSVALMVRDYSPFSEERFGEADFPPGPGPFRVDLVDRGGARTVDSGPGIEPFSLTMKGRRVSWTHDGQPRTTLVNDQVPAKRQVRQAR